MKKIDKPIFNISEVALSSVDTLRSKDLKAEVVANIKIFQDFEDDFDLKKQTNTLYQIGRNIDVNLNINTDFLKKLYTQKMLDKKNDTRRYYDFIIMSAKSGKCPQCNQRQADTLDHYLAKSDYPILSVSPLNLIPSCATCNKNKLIEFPTSEEDELIHPYYDDFDSINWLECSIVQIKPLLFLFSVKNSIFPGKEFLEQRLINHFESFALNELYKTHSAEEFENITYQIEKLYHKGGFNELKEYLFDCFESRKNSDINSWQTAFYKCLFENDDFCNGLFI